MISIKHDAIWIWLNVAIDQYIVAGLVKMKTGQRSKGQRSKGGRCFLVEKDEVLKLFLESTH